MTIASEASTGAAFSCRHRIDHATHAGMEIATRRAGGAWQALPTQSYEREGQLQQLFGGQPNLIPLHRLGDHCGEAQAKAIVEAVTELAKALKPESGVRRVQ